MPYLAASDLGTEEVNYGYGSGSAGMAGYDMKTAANNLEVYRRINALLDDTLDLNSLPNLKQQAGMIKQEQPVSFDNVQWNYQDALPYRSAPQQTLPSNLEHLLGSLGTTGAPTSNQTVLQQPAEQLLYSQPDATQYINTGLQQFNQPIVSSAANTGYYTSVQPTQAAVSMAPSYNSEPTKLIQGAISNRTLEQLTETLTRPARPITKHDQTKIRSGDNNIQNNEYFLNPLSAPYTLHDANLAGNMGTQYVSSMPAQPQPAPPPIYTQPTQQTTLPPAYQQLVPPANDANALGRLFGSRSSTPDSDSSGFCSNPGSVSDIDTSASTLVDLMNTLTLSQSITGAGNNNLLGNAGLGGQLGNATSQQLASVGQLDLLRALSGMANQEVNRSRLENGPLSNQSGLELSDRIRTLSMNNMNPLNPLFATNTSDPYSIEKAAKLYRNAATICEATCTWSGQLPPKVYKNATYSCKVFLGGVPWDITETGLQHAFKQFGNIKIEWPGKEGKHPRYPTRAKNDLYISAGYVYVLFEHCKAVSTLLQACTQDFSSSGEYFFKISSRRMRSKEVQVIPWVLSDSNNVRQPSQRLEPSKTVFVGALHGVLTAEALANIMNDLFGNVVYAGIDTDKHKYPIGSGRVTFSSNKSYMKAVNAAFVEIKTPKFTKKIQIDPYLEDSLCSVCSLAQGPFFCRDLICFRYYCRGCWTWTHAFELMQHHKPLMRNSRGGQVQGNSNNNAVYSAIDSVS